MVLISESGSNSRELLDEITKAETKPERSSVHETTSPQDLTTEDVESYAKSTMGLGNSSQRNENIGKVLGLNWNTLSDQFYFDFANLLEYATSLAITKRSILKVL